MSFPSSSSGASASATNAPTSSNGNVTLYLIYLNVILYATCYQLQRPLEPYMVAKIGTTRDASGEYANLQSFFSVMQTVGSLLAGWFLDRFGAKWGFVISFTASALSYLLLSQATTLELLYLSKVPTIFQSGFLCAQLAASQATKDGAERVQALGRLTVSYTVGSVVGPAIGGWLGSSGDYYFGAKLAVGGSLLSVLLTVLFMPSSVPSPSSSPSSSKSNGNYVAVPDREPDDAADGSDSKVNSSGTVQQLLASTMGVIQVVWLLLSTKVITSVANAMSQAAFPLILKDTYRLNEQQMGMVMSAMSGFNGVVNAFMLAPIVAFLGGKLTNVIEASIGNMALVSFVLAAAALPSVASISWAGGIGQFLGLSFVLSIFQYTLFTTITSESTTRVKPTEKGTLLGLEHTLFAAARIAAPQVGVSLLKFGGVTAVSLACGSVFLVVFGIWSVFKGTLKNGDKNDGDKKNTFCEHPGAAAERKEK